MPALLEVLRVEAQYRWTKVLHGVDFAVESGGITTILGANGAGKTTTLRAVCGMIKTAGEIRFDGQRIDGRATEDIVRLGIAHVPEGRGTFVNLTVEENLRLGAYGRRQRGGLDEDFARVYLYFPVLRERRGQVAGTLSGGEQQMLAVARALMLRPRLLLLDEPSAALAPRFIDQVYATLVALNRDGLAMLIVEQNVEAILAVAHRVFVLDLGRNAFDGTPAELRGSDRIRRLYLGEEEGAG